MPRRTTILVPGGLLVVGVGVAIALWAGSDRSAQTQQTRPIVNERAGLEGIGASGQRSDDAPAHLAHEGATAPAVSKEERLLTLRELSRRADKPAVRALLAALEDNDPEIRSEALEAVIQTGDTEVSGDLRKLSGSVADPEFKVKLLEAADYIALPAFKDERITEQPEKGSGGGNRPR